MLTGAQLTRGPARELIDTLTVDRGRTQGWLVDDDRRIRPRYEDGLRLTARHLTRDQQYFLTRQADLGQLTGGGVVAGLQVSLIAGNIQISAGHGLTPSGELVALREAVQVDVNDLPRVQNLEAQFGLSTRPAASLVNLTGNFVLSLRPVEYTANPVALYPTTVSGERRLEDGDIIEATALTLVPFPEGGASEEPARARARLAKRIFLGTPVDGLAATALPVAVVGIDRGVVRWVDADLVRREAGVDSALGISRLGRRSVREAHLRQYVSHLEDTLAERTDALLDERFEASDYFEILPPVGPLPPT
ncbi:MAG: hypothetical protein AAFN74_16505, partial [Myxococcota bacterium]